MDNSEVLSDGKLNLLNLFYNWSNIVLLQILFVPKIVLGFYVNVRKNIKVNVQDFLGEDNLYDEVNYNVWVLKVNSIVLGVEKAF